MDPIVSLFTDHGIKGVALYVLWKLALKLIAAWRENSKERNVLEVKRLDQQHDQHTALSGAIGGLSERVHESTSASLQQLAAVKELVSETKETNRCIERLIENTPPTGTRVARMG